MRVWKEAFQMFVNYLRKIPTIPFKHLDAVFARNEYQKDKGSLSHAHKFIQLNWEKTTQSKTDFFNDIVRSSMFDIMRTSGV